jgi:hypothetical protein
MKRFTLLPSSTAYGTLNDDGKERPAWFLTPHQAKFMASFRSIRAASE